MTFQTIIKLFNLQVQQPGSVAWLIAADYLEEHDIQPLATAFRQGLLIVLNHGYSDGDDGYGRGDGHGYGSGRGYGGGNGGGKGWGDGKGDGKGCSSGYGNGHGRGHSC